MDPNSYVVAKFAFETEDENALSFQTGDIITLYDRPEGEWWLGEKKSKDKDKPGKRGFFPHAYVSPLPGVPSRWMVGVGKQNFQQTDVSVPGGRSRELLYFDIGEFLVLFHKSEKDAWWVGCNRERVGYVNREMLAHVEENAKKQFLERLFPPPKPAAALLSDTIILKVRVGNNHSKAMKFDQSLTVSEILLLIEKKLNPSHTEQQLQQASEQHGLFLCPPLSMWCSEVLPLYLYELKAFTEVAFLKKKQRDELITQFETNHSPLFARIICPFQAEESTMSMSVNQGEIVQVIDIVSEEWWECKKTISIT